MRTGMTKMSPVGACIVGVAVFLGTCLTSDVRPASIRILR
jgi:hypothetical protein